MPKYKPNDAGTEGLDRIQRLEKHVADSPSLTPSSSLDNVIQPSSVGAVPLVLKAAAGQTADLLQIQDQSGAVIGGFSAAGGLNGGSQTFFTPRREGKPQRILESFGASTTWTNSGFTTFTTGTTTQYKLGLGKSVRFVSSGTGAGNFAASLTYSSALDLSAVTTIGVWLFIDAGVANLDTLNVYLGTDTTYAANFRIPASSAGSLMGTALALPTNQWVLVPFAVAEKVATGSPSLSSIGAVRIRMADTGSGTVSGYFGGVVLNPTPQLFTNGIVSFCTDDGFDSDYVYFAPTLAKYGYPGTLFPIVDLIGTAGRMTVAQLQELHDSFGYGMSCHSYTLADHTAGFANLTAAQVQSNVTLNKQWLQANGLIRGKDFLAWPNSSFSDATIAVARDYFTAAYTTASTPRQAFPPMNNLYQQNRLFLTSTTVLSDVQTEIDKAVSWPCHLVIAMHQIVASGATGNQTNLSLLQSIVDYVATKTVAVRTIDDVFRTEP